MEKLQYTINDSTIVALLGEQNFSSDESAILEIVKNAYDANSLHLTISFYHDYISFEDNGCGMNADDIKDHWMHIGDSEKKYLVVDENNKKRIQAGSKGIGRFALARLGGKIYLCSKKNGSEGVVWKTDWNESILDYDETLTSTGTTIKVERLRTKWNKRRIDSLASYLNITYKDDAMSIDIVGVDGNSINVHNHFDAPVPGINCRSVIKIKYDNDSGNVTTHIDSDEFDVAAKKYYLKDDLEHYEKTKNVYNELQGSDIDAVIDDKNELSTKIHKIGNFTALLYFNIKSTKDDKERFLYKYTDIPNPIDGGIVLYRNAFSISSYEGKKDWLELGKRMRKSPAAASHPTGQWRVRENQLSGYVSIDKERNKVLEDMANRQGLDENDYYKIFVQIIIIGIREFESYRQNIIRKINVKNKIKDNTETLIIDKIVKNHSVVKTINNEDSKKLQEELKTQNKIIKQYKREQADRENEYSYDIRILNVFATNGLKSSSIAHELRNSEDEIDVTYQYTVEALKEYGMWDKLNSAECTRFKYNNVPELLKQNNEISQKIVAFINSVLQDIEKQKFENTNQNIKSIVEEIAENWKRDYSWVNIYVNINDNLLFEVSRDEIQVIFDNLILNSIQQNDSKDNLSININAENYDDRLEFIYSDNGVGLNEKYKDNPRRILDVQETTRRNGHGLGMWILNNTCIMSGGEVTDIVSSNNGFEIHFYLGRKNYNGR